MSDAETARGVDALDAQIYLSRNLGVSLDDVVAALDALVEERLLRFSDGRHILDLVDDEAVEVDDVLALTLLPDGIVTVATASGETARLGEVDVEEGSA